MTVRPRPNPGFRPRSRLSPDLHPRCFQALAPGPPLALGDGGEGRAGCTWSWEERTFLGAGEIKAASWRKWYTGQEFEELRGGVRRGGSWNFSASPWPFPAAWPRQQACSSSPFVQTLEFHATRAPKGSLSEAPTGDWSAKSLLCPLCQAQPVGATSLK